MSYLGSYALDDVCTFYANTHTPATGAAVDADTPPDYRVYEEITGTPIATGTMALLDAANTAGFYSGQVTLSTANGFEVGKGYAIRIALVVGGATGVDMQRLQLGAKVDVRLLGGNLQSAADLQDFADAGYDPATNALSDARLANLDAAVSSRSIYAGGAVASVTAPVTVGTNADKTGYALSAAGITALWAALTAGLTTVGSIGKLLVDNLNAAITSRSSHAAADVWGVATRLLTAGTNIVLAKGTGLTGFNDVSPAQVQGEVATALVAYDGATGAELAGGLASVQDDLAALHDLSPEEVGAEVGTAFSVVGLTSVVTGRLDAPVTSRASQTSVDGLPDMSELTSALATADDAVLAAIAALHNLSAAGAQAAAEAALTAYQAAGVGDAMTLAPGALTANVLALDAVQEIATAIKTLVVESEGSYTLGGILSLVLAALVGLTTDGGATFRTPNGQAVRIQGTTNGLNERVSMALTPSA